MAYILINPYLASPTFLEWHFQINKCFKFLWVLYSVEEKNYIQDKVSGFFFPYASLVCANNYKCNFGFAQLGNMKVILVTTIQLLTAELPSNHIKERIESETKQMKKSSSVVRDAKAMRADCRRTET